MKQRLLVLLALLLLPTTAFAEFGTLFNQEAVGSPSASIVIPGTAGQRVRLYTLDMKCSPSATSAAAGLAVNDGAAPIYTKITMEILNSGAGIFHLTWPLGLAANTGNSMTISLDCGGSNTAKLSVAADRL